MVGSHARRHQLGPKYPQAAATVPDSDDMTSTADRSTKTWGPACSEGTCPDFGEFSLENPRLQCKAHLQEGLPRSAARPRACNDRRSPELRISSERASNAVCQRGKAKDSFKTKCLG
jgi:hypothetical protein